MSDKLSYGQAYDQRVRDIQDRIKAEHTGPTIEFRRIVRSISTFAKIHAPIFPDSLINLLTL